MKQYLVHGAQALQPSSARLILAIAAIHNFDVWSCDVKLAYLQSAEPLTRRVFIKNPAPEFELEPHQCFELLRPLYGLSDAGDLWHKTLHSHLTEDLQLTPTKADPSLYFAYANRELVGLSGSYVDDLLRAGTREFRNSSPKRIGVLKQLAMKIHHSHSLDLTLPQAQTYLTPWISFSI